MMKLNTLYKIVNGTCNKKFFNCYFREAPSAEAVFQLRPAHNIQYTHAYNNYYRQVQNYCY